MSSIKGADKPVAAQRLLGVPERITLSGVLSRIWSVGDGRCPPSRACWTAPIDGHGAVVTVVGSPGIGKSRLVREVAAIAAGREVEVFTAYCESHASRHSLPCRGAAAAGSHRRAWPGRPGRS